MVVNSKNWDPLISAYLSIEGTNISTVTNLDGEFSLKVPENLNDANVLISNLGFQSRSLPSSFFRNGEVVVQLQESVEELSEVALFTYTDPAALVRNMLKTRGTNYFNDRLTMTAFYRETIKKGRRNYSLS